MSKYKLMVFKLNNNDNYEKELAEFKDNNRRGYYTGLDIREDYPKKELAERSLEVILTEEEYGKVKESVIKTFE